VIEVNCPLCGSLVRAPGAKTHSRLLCKKCHAPLHLSKTGTAVVGEPPDVEQEYQELKQKVHQELKRVPVKKIVLGSAVVLTLGVVLYALFGPAERLERAAERAARALAGGDLNTLKSLAAPDTADDVALWYETVQPQLAKTRQQWAGKDEVVEAHVAEEDHAQRKGAASVTVHSASSGTRDVSLANPAEATAPPSAPFEVATDWTLSGWGRWKLDGHKTYARVRPAH